MKKNFLLLVFGIVGLINVSGQEPGLNNGEINGVKIKRVRNFTGESLRGYIDGGANLYLEYGFSGLRVTEFSKGKSRYKAEVWKMNHPESAFGIFSVMRFRCTSKPDFLKLSCQNKYQVHYCKGSYYVNVINTGGTAADSTMSVDVAKLIAEKIQAENIDLNKYITVLDPEKILESSVLVKGRLGVNRGASDLESFFRDAEDFGALLIQKSGVTIAGIRFNDTSGLDKFVQLKTGKPFPEDGSSVTENGRTWSRKDETHLVVIIPDLKTGSEQGNE